MNINIVFIRKNQKTYELIIVNKIYPTFMENIFLLHIQILEDSILFDSVTERDFVNTLLLFIPSSCFHSFIRLKKIKSFNSTLKDIFYHLFSIDIIRKQWFNRGFWISFANSLL